MTPQLFPHAQVIPDGLVVLAESCLRSMLIFMQRAVDSLGFLFELRSRKCFLEDGLFRDLMDGFMWVLIFDHRGDGSFRLIELLMSVCIFKGFLGVVVAILVDSVGHVDL